MKTIAIICEYNPFHYGHLYQLRRVKEKFGDDTRIIAIMSGSYVQRGDLAGFDKYARAASAVKHGASLVIELPFPYSYSSAEFFASAGVYIAVSIGVSDHLCFGSMSTDIDRLLSLEELLSSEEFASEFSERSEDQKYATLGHAALVELICRELFPVSACELLRSPNDILGVEYLRAIKKFGSKLSPVTIPMLETESNDKYTSASYVRDRLAKGAFNPSALPEYSAEGAISELSSGSGPADINRLSAAIISRLMSAEAGSLDIYYGCGGGLGNRLIRSAASAPDLGTLTQLAATKRYTDSRIRRALLSCFIGTTSSDVRELPEYTTALAMNSVGRELLREIKKKGNLEILTKPADQDKLSPAARTQSALRNRADSIRNLTLPTPRAPGDIFRISPYCEF